MIFHNIINYVKFKYGLITKAIKLILEIKEHSNLQTYFQDLIIIFAYNLTERLGIRLPGFLSYSYSLVMYSVIKY